jgi:hypothetical protein
LKSTNGIVNSSTLSDISSPIPKITTTDDERERLRAENRARNRQSLKLLQRATWTPGDGFSLNLPQEFLCHGSLTGIEDEEEEDFNKSEGLGNTAHKNTSSVSVGVVEKERYVGKITDGTLLTASSKWVDRFM